MKNPLQDLVIRVPIKSLESSPSEKCGHFQRMTSATYKTCKSKESKVNLVLTKINKLGKKADILAHGFCEHVKLSPKISKTVKGKLSLGARVVQLGGIDKVFRELLRVEDEEKLLKAFQCYLSTTTGPIAGLLFISTLKVAFCSETSLKLVSPDGESTKLHYKVSIPLRKIKTVTETENVKKASQKYIQIMTVDHFDFWFMGFLNHQKTLKHLLRAISKA